MKNTIILWWVGGIVGLIVMVWMLTRAPISGAESRERAILRILLRSFPWALLLAPLTVATGFTGVIMPASFGVMNVLIEWPQLDGQAIVDALFPAAISISVTWLVLFLIFGSLQRLCFPDKKHP